LCNFLQTVLRYFPFSFSRIARNCGVTLADPREANPWMYYQYFSYPGQVLVIPDGYAEPETGDPEPARLPRGYAGSYRPLLRGESVDAS
jgi:hypothetical protein